MKTIQNINWLIEQYRQNIEKLEEDRKQDAMTISNAYRVAKIGVYSKVVEDLQAVLEEGERMILIGIPNMGTVPIEVMASVVKKYRDERNRNEIKYYNTLL